MILQEDESDNYAIKSSISLTYLRCHDDGTFDCQGMAGTKGTLFHFLDIGDGIVALKSVNTSYYLAINFFGHTEGFQDDTSDRCHFKVINDGD